MPKKLYIAYGSNLNKKEMAFRCPSAVPAGVTYLENYKLECRTYLNIRKEKGTVVKAGVWEIDEKDEKLLDHYEGYPYLYRKVVLPNQIIIVDEHPECCTDDTPEAFEADAFVYIMNEDAGMPLEPSTESYFWRCIEGYYDFDLPLEPLIDSRVEAVTAEAERKEKLSGERK